MLKYRSDQFWNILILSKHSFSLSTTAWRVSKYRVISGQFFPVFSPNTGKYGPEKTPYLDTFDAVHLQAFK